MTDFFIECIIPDNKLEDETDDTIKQITTPKPGGPSLSMALPASGSFVSPAVSLNRFGLADSFRQEFWDPNILASTNWLVPSAVDGQDYCIPLQAFPMSLTAQADSGEIQTSEVVDTAIVRAQPATMTIPNSGGALEEAYRVAYFDTFTAKTGIKILGAPYMDTARVKAMVENNAVDVDVLNIDATEAAVLSCPAVAP